MVFQCIPEKSIQAEHLPGKTVVFLSSYSNLCATVQIYYSKIKLLNSITLNLISSTGILENILKTQFVFFELYNSSQYTAPL